MIWRTTFNIADDNGYGTVDVKEFVASMNTLQDQNAEASQILFSIVQKRKAAAAAIAPPRSFLLDVSSMVPFIAGLGVVIAFSFRQRCRA